MEIHSNEQIEEVTPNTEGAVELQAHEVWEALVDIEIENLKIEFPDQTDMQLLDRAVKIAQEKYPSEYEAAMKHASEFDFGAA
jgi:hypothetical protein